MEEQRVVGNALLVVLSKGMGIYAKMPPLQQYLTWVVLAVLISVPLVRMSRRAIARSFYRIASHGMPAESPELPPMILYAGFWRRMAAFLLDLVWYMVVVFLPMLFVTNSLESVTADFFIRNSYGIVYGVSAFQMAIPLILWFAFLIYLQATPGKKLINTYVADAATGGRPSLLQLFILYIGYLIALLPFGLGLFWIGWNRKKQGWHNLLSRTVVLQRIEHPGAKK